jgi:hypothetical protein
MIAASFPISSQLNRRLPDRKGDEQTGDQIDGGGQTAQPQYQQ